MKALYYSILKYQPENLALLQERFDLVELKTPSEDTDEVLASIEVAFAPLGYQFDKAKIDRMPKLRAIVSNTTGEPHIDRMYAESKGVAVFSSKFEQAFLSIITPTAEHAWGLLLALTRRTPWAFEDVLSGNWDRRPWGGKAMLSSLSIGIAGYGRLGSLVGEYARAFRMKDIAFYDPFVAAGAPGIRKVDSLEELVSTVDIVTVHIPAEPETHKLFNKELFAHFKHGSYFINTSRGELVDEDALLGALRTGALAGAALDVFDGEYREDHAQVWAQHPLRAYANENDTLLLTPHIGGSTQDAWFKTERWVIDKALAYVEKGKE